jgi:hypothetical protein
MLDNMLYNNMITVNIMLVCSFFSKASHTGGSPETFDNQNVFDPFFSSD